MNKLLILLLLFPLLVTSGYAETNQNFSLLKAIQLTLQYNNEILIQKENNEIAQGRIKITQSSFDTMVKPSLAYQHGEVPIVGSIENRTDTVTTGINASKKFRIGLSSGLAITTKRIDSLNSSQDPTNTSTITFSLNVPLLEGLGVNVADADELAAKSDLIVAKYNFLHTVSQSIYQTIVYYWNYLLSINNLQAYEKSLDRTQKIFKQVTMLIEKGERPKADIEQIAASLANKRSILYKGKQEVISSKNLLASLIGLPYQNLKIVSYPVTDFPVVHDGDFCEVKAGIQELADEALMRRRDYLALKQAQKTDEINLVSAFDKLKNNLDLNFNVSYQRLKQDKHYGAMIDSLWNEKPGFNMSVLLNYEWPIENSYAKGSVQRYKAILRQNIYNRTQLERTIYANLRIEVSNLKKSYDSLIESEKSLAFYKKAIFNEKKKYELGMSTIIDVINLEDKVIDANLNKIAAQYQLAVAIIKLKYEMGQLIHAAPEKNDFNFKLNDVAAANIRTGCD